MGNVKIVCFGGIAGFYARKCFPKLCSKLYLQYLRLAMKKKNLSLVNKAMQMDEAPLVHINLETINKCNGTCSFCPNNKYVDKRKAKRMDTKTFEKVILDLEDRHYNGVLSLQGNGEPFLDKDMTDRILYAREKLPDAKLIIFTNGSLLTEDILDKIAGKLDTLYINNYCESYRLNERSKMVYDYVKKNPDKFGNMKIQIEYRYRNEVLSTRGGYSPNKCNHKKKVCKSLCILPYLETYIFSDGSVGLCCCDVRKTYNFGNVSDNTIFEIFNGARLMDIRKKMKEGRDGLEFCKFCDFESKGGRRLKWFEKSKGSILL